MARNNKNANTKLKAKYRKNFNIKFTSSTGDAVINNYFRRHLTEWRQASLEEYNNECIITHSKNNLEVHHINVTFQKIIAEAHVNLNIQQYRTLTNYSLVELALLKEEILRLHFKYGLGVPITHNLHKQYHFKYRNNISAQTFHEFSNEIRLMEHNEAVS